MNFKILLLIFLLSSSYILVAQETIVDTLYSIPELDGGIGYVIDEDIYRVDNSYGGFYVGDTFGSISGSVEFARGYLCFPLPNIPENYSLNSATLFVYQYWSSANDEYWNYPIFNIGATEIEPPCLIEHIDYGNFLDAGDFNLPVLHPAYTISTTPEQDWRSLDIAEWIIDDIENNRNYNQTRLRLSLDYDDDNFTDALGFSSGNHPIYKPYIVYRLSPNYSNDDNEIEDFNYDLSNYPNPFILSGTKRFSSATISFNLPDEVGNPRLEIYNVKGQRVRTISIHFDSAQCDNKAVWDGTDNRGKPVSAGIYFYKLNLESSPIKKMLIIK